MTVFDCLMCTKGKHDECERQWLQFCKCWRNWHGKKRKLVITKRGKK